MWKNQILLGKFFFYNKVKNTRICLNENVVITPILFSNSTVAARIDGMTKDVESKLCNI